MQFIGMVPILTVQKSGCPAMDKRQLHRGWCDAADPVRGREEIQF